MKNPFSYYLILFGFFLGLAQSENDRFAPIAQQLDSLAIRYPEFDVPVKLDLDLEQVSIADFLQSMAELHEINLTIDPSLKNRFMLAELTKVSVKEVLLYLCKTQDLTIDFTGSILSIYPYVSPPTIPLPPYVYYDIVQEKVSLKLNDHRLEEVFRQLTEQTPFNLLFTAAIREKPLNFFVEDVALEDALTQLAQLHDLVLDQTEEGFFLFDVKPPSEKNGRAVWPKNKEQPFEVLSDGKHIRVQAKNYPIHTLIEDLVTHLEINWYQAEALSDMGNISLKIDAIKLDELLPLLFENQKIRFLDNGEGVQPPYTFRKQDNRYFFGTENTISARSVVKITLQHRSVELLEDPYREQSNVVEPPSTIGNQSFANPTNPQGFSGSRASNFNPPQINSNSPSFLNPSPQALKQLNSLIPKALTEGLQIQVDKELNSFLVLGSAQKVKRFQAFIQKIDQAVPVILIEVMLIEVNKSTQLDTGISWGIGEEATSDQGNIFPDIDTRLGQSTVNRILGGYSQLRALNLGKLQPNFFLQLKALEESGSVKVLSSPRMATLNGHRAVFANSEISYYAYTAQNFYGFQNPQTSEITNYIPISAGLTLSVKPYVTGDNGITLDIFVKQSSFNNVRVAEDAPPGIESREFSSIVRMQNKDIAILGGLEQNTKNNTGKGVPILSRIPVIKWLFSGKQFSNSKRKLTVLIQPTIIE